MANGADNPKSLTFYASIGAIQYRNTGPDSRKQQAYIAKIPPHVVALCICLYTGLWLVWKFSGCLEWVPAQFLQLLARKHKNSPVVSSGTRHVDSSNQASCGCHICSVIVSCPICMQSRFDLPTASFIMCAYLSYIVYFFDLSVSPVLPTIGIQTPQSTRHPSHLQAAVAAAVAVTWPFPTTGCNHDRPHQVITSLRIQVCPKKGITNFYSKDGIGTLNPILGIAWCCMGPPSVAMPGLLGWVHHE